MASSTGMHFKCFLLINILTFSCTARATVATEITVVEATSTAANGMSENKLEANKVQRFEFNFIQQKDINYVRYILYLQKNKNGTTTNRTKLKAENSSHFLNFDVLYQKFLTHKRMTTTKTRKTTRPTTTDQPTNALAERTNLHLARISNMYAYLQSARLPKFAIYWHAYL